ncbi:MAG TPA: thiamine pyrophosphate-dependent enzyme, partial [Candidatus Binatia bacterium]|nr:thiamine pyrophosphate-dependent enzyme [Candidatus Binatia bacterium]
MPKKKTKSRADSNGNRPRNGSKTPLLAKNARNGSPQENLSSSARPDSRGRLSLQENSLRTYSIPDTRLEHPNYIVRQSVEKDKDGTEHVRYEVSGDLDAPVPSIRDSKYLSKQQAIEIYRYMLLNRKMETALENLYKQGKVVGGVYFGLGQEACSCASSYALDKDDWFAPMIRNQGALLVRGFHASDTMMQYMAK